MPSHKPVPLLVLAAVLAAGSASGCCFLFVDGPPARHRSLPYFECTSSNGLPALDATLGGLIGIGALGSLADHSSSSTGSSTGTTAVLLVEAGILLGSAASGFSKTSDCREAKADLLRRLIQQPPPEPAPPYDPWLAPGPFAGAPPAESMKQRPP